MSDPEAVVSADDDAESPSAQLRVAIERFYDLYFRRWGSEAENQLYMDIAEAFRPSVHSLAITPQLLASIRVLHDEVGTPAELNDIPGFVRTLTSHPIVRDGVEIRLAYDAVGKLRGAEGRLGDVLQLISNRKLTERAEAYLHRATQLYLWGFGQEAVVMCGAALEAAYPVRFLDPEMVRLGVEKSGDRFESYHYERAAVESKVFSKDQRVLAREIRNARNSVVHEDPAHSFSPQRALEGAAELLARLFPHDPEIASP